jgi:hypothetical protein
MSIALQAKIVAALFALATLGLAAVAGDEMWAAHVADRGGAAQADAGLLIT